jgi:sRNA-binding carbon storage regulator CsrA
VTLNKHVALTLPADVYARLAEMARAEDRDPTQQARVILGQALESLEEMRHLVLKRGIGDGIVLRLEGAEVRVTLQRDKDGKTVFWVDAPDRVKVVRIEVLER